jgi:YD repeat-containing protein
MRRIHGPDGLVTRYAYDELNRLSSVTTGGGVTEYTYFRDSRLKRVRYPNGSQADQAYDPAGRLQLIDNKHNTAQVSRFEYTFDANGNRTQQVETNGGAPETTTYAFDDADRLRSQIS